jgi:hypothetical protein
VIAALFVESPGPYTDLANVDPWDKQRDARKYPGPWPVVAHPPCARWGRYWNGGPSAKVKRKKGDDGGCFKAALEAVRKWGGVLEHPEGSHAWEWFGLRRPMMGCGWTAAGDFIGYTCQVEQGHYGHRARKKTWLYANSTHLPILKWGPSKGIRLEEGYHSSEARREARKAGVKPMKRINEKERVYTPLPFMYVLLKIADHARVSNMLVKP